jgi:hypothetical protein
MEFKNLIDITPEIEGEARKLFEASQKLKKLLGKHHFDISIYSSAADHISIYDRHEYSRDGLGTDLGFFVHRIYKDGSVVLDFINEDNEEGKAFDEAFNEYMEGQDGENG